MGLFFLCQAMRFLKDVKSGWTWGPNRPKKEWRIQKIELPALKQRGHS